MPGGDGGESSFLEAIHAILAHGHTDVLPKSRAAIPSVDPTPALSSDTSRMLAHFLDQLMALGETIQGVLWAPRFSTLDHLLDGGNNAFTGWGIKAGMAAFGASEKEPHSQENAFDQY